MRARTALLAVAAVLATACGGVIDEGPSTAATGVTVAEAIPLVARNFTLVWPEPTTVANGEVDVSTGCRTDPNSLRAAGPPWTPIYERTVRDPAPEFVAQVLANLDALTAHGFTRDPDPIPNDAPENRSYTDTRGFTVSALTYGADPKQRRFAVSSTAPCAAE